MPMYLYYTMIDRLYKNDQLATKNTFFDQWGDLRGIFFIRHFGSCFVFATATHSTYVITREEVVDSNFLKGVP